MINPRSQQDFAEEIDRLRQSVGRAKNLVNTGAARDRLHIGLLSPNFGDGSAQLNAVLGLVFEEIKDDLLSDALAMLELRYGEREKDMKSRRDLKMTTARAEPNKEYDPDDPTAVPPSVHAARTASERDFAETDALDREHPLGSGEGGDPTKGDDDLEE